MIGRRRRVRDSDSLIQECEAFLIEYLDEMTETSGGQPSPSAWFNILAHGDLEELQRLAHSAGRAQGIGDRWAEATSFLAAEILWTGGGDRDAVRRIPAEIIVPIQLKWQSHTLVGSPSEVVREAARALERCTRSPSNRGNRVR